MGKSRSIQKICLYVSNFTTNATCIGLGLKPGPHVEERIFMLTSRNVHS